MAFPHHKYAMHTPFGVEHSYNVMEGFHFQARPLGKVHKDGHAIFSTSHLPQVNRYCLNHWAKNWS